MGSDILTGLGAQSGHDSSLKYGANGCDIEVLTLYGAWTFNRICVEGSW